MSYRRCDACGAKALTAATQCPRCTTPFRLVDARGRRLEFAKCGHCGSGYPTDEAGCRWCSASPAARKLNVPWRLVAGIVLALTAGWAYQNFRAGRPIVPDTAKAVGTDSSAEQAAILDSGMSATGIADSTITRAPTTPPGSDTPSTGNPSTLADVQPKATPVVWVTMTSTTWVNIRERANKDSRIVGVIAPSTSAELGAIRGGWRQVRAVDLTGWVDPHLFVR